MCVHAGEIMTETASLEPPGKFFCGAPVPVPLQCRI